MSVKYFTKISTDERNELLEFFLQKSGLLLKIFMVACCRARRSKNDLLGLKESEFLLSETEYKKFGLKKSQKGKLSRALAILISLKVVSKTGSKTGNAHSTIYRLNKGVYDFFDYKTGNDTGNEQGTSRDKLRMKECKDILDHLNHVSGRDIKHIDSHYKFIRARLADGHSIDDCKLVIEHKFNDPGFDNKFFRHSTLFQASKFDGYLADARENQKPIVEKVFTDDPV